MVFFSIREIIKHLFMKVARSSKQIIFLFFLYIILEMNRKVSDMLCSVIEHVGSGVNSNEVLGTTQKQVFLNTS